MMETRSSVIALIGLLACGSIAHAQSHSWDKVLSASRRFVVLDAFGEEAVRDRETGLVWNGGQATQTETLCEPGQTD